MRPGWSFAEQTFPCRCALMHESLLEVLPQLGINVRYESALNRVVDATGGVAAQVPAERLMIVMRNLDNHFCTISVGGYTRLDPARPADFRYPSNAQVILMALARRLRATKSAE